MTTLDEYKEYLINYYRWPIMDIYTSNELFNYKDINKKGLKQSRRKLIFYGLIN